MFSPGGFDATLEKWSTQSIYAQIKPVDHLSKSYTCVIFDRRETGESGGRVERVTWKHYVAQGKGLLEHLKIERAHIMGACMGCCPAVAFGVAHPETALSLVLYWPVGGARYQDQRSPALCAASRVRAPARARCRRHPRCGRQEFRSGSPRRSVGLGPAARSGVCSGVREAGCGALQVAGHVDGPDADRSRHRSRRRAGGLDSAEPPRLDRSGRGPFPHSLVRALPAGVPRAFRVLGRTVAEQTAQTAPAKMLEFLHRHN